MRAEQLVQEPLVTALLSIDSAATQHSELFPVDLRVHTTSSLALVGQWHALFQVLTGEVVVRKDAICVAGHDARHLVISGTLGVIASRFTWPDGQTVEQVLELSAGLLGLSASEASREVRQVLQQLQLTAHRQQKLHKLSTLQARVVALAHASLCSPRYLAVEDALLGLTTQDSRQFLDVLDRARLGRSLIVHVPHAVAGCMERLLVDSCEQVLVLERGAVTLQGPPAQLDAGRGLFQITVLGQGVEADGETLRGALAEHGVVVRSFTPLPRAAATGSPPQGPVARLVVELDPLSPTLPLFAAAKSCNSTVLDLHALPTSE